MQDRVPYEAVPGVALDAQIAAESFDQDSQELVSRLSATAW